VADQALPESLEVCGVKFVNGFIGTHPGLVATVGEYRYGFGGLSDGGYWYTVAMGVAKTPTWGAHGDTLDSVVEAMRDNMGWRLREQREADENRQKAERWFAERDKLSEHEAEKVDRP